MRSSGEASASSSWAGGSRGFTLVELLVVVGIVAILIALFFPALVGARRQAQTVRCLSNQRQLMAAMLTYAADHDEQLPFEGWIGGASYPTAKIKNWLFNPVVAGLPPASASGVRTGLLWPYLKDEKIYRCPIDDGPWQPNSIQNVTSYVLNGALTNYNNQSIQTLPLRKFPGDSIISWEIPLYSTTKVSVNDASNYPPEGVTVRHGRATTVGCIDGHAELVRDDDFNRWCQSGPNRLWCSPARKDGGASLFIASNPIPMFY